MMKTLITVALIFLAAIAYGQNTPVIKFKTLDQIIQSKSDSIVVINFWATWCAPCVKELPYFEKLSGDHPEIKVLLVNLDFADKLDKVNQFLKRKSMNSKVVLLDEIDYNSWIDLVDKDWGGAIPATLIINQKTGQRKFVDYEINGDDLQSLIENVK